MRVHADALSNQNQEGFEIVGFVVDDAPISDASLIHVQAANGEMLTFRVIGDIDEERAS